VCSSDLNKRATTKYSIVAKQKDPVIWAGSIIGGKVYQYCSGFISRVSGDTVFMMRYGKSFIENEEYEKDLGRTWFFDCKVYKAMLRLSEPNKEIP